MKIQKLAVAIGTALVATGVTPVLAADSPHSISANVGAVTNYIWRGVSQTDDDPAVQGGVDYAHSSGFYQISNRTVVRIGLVYVDNALTALAPAGRLGQV